MASNLYHSIAGLPVTMPLGTRLPLLYQWPDGNMPADSALGGNQPGLKPWPNGRADWNTALPEESVIREAARIAPDGILLFDIETWSDLGTKEYDTELALRSAVLAGGGMAADQIVKLSGGRITLDEADSISRRTQSAEDAQAALDWILDRSKYRTLHEPTLQAVLDRYTQVARWARDENPAVRIGFWNFPVGGLGGQHLLYFWQTQTTARDVAYLSWRLGYDRLSSGKLVPGRLPDLLDFVCPVLYAGATPAETRLTDVEFWTQAANAMIPQARAWQHWGKRDRRIMVFLSPYLAGSGQQISYELALAMTKFCKLRHFDRYWWGDFCQRGPDPSGDWYTGAAA